MEKENYFPGKIHQVEETNSPYCSLETDKRPWSSKTITRLSHNINMFAEQMKQTSCCNSGGGAMII